ncbi:MAG: 2-oxo acid dehydrogenase subunit E2 [Candidatus Nanopelagicales bacterium]|nr:2-oxo acid dehydrogenase subunit E2 [Candidatus Nanopelagicales bacterium]
MAEFRMPSLGADMDVGTIIEWLVQPGDPVRRGQIVAVVDTAKAAIEIESFEDGVLEELLVGPGTQVPVGTPIARIGPPVAGAVPAAAAAVTTAARSAGGTVAPVTLRVAPSAPDSGPAPAPAAPAVAAQANEAPAVAAPAPAAPAGRDRFPATPPVRHLAHQLGVDLDAVVGSGPDGHITHDDVRAAAAAAAAPARVRATPRARRLAAEHDLDLRSISGSGAHGAVLAADVLAVTAAAPAAGATATPPTATPTTAAPTTAAPTTVAGPPPGPRAASPDRKAAMRAAIASLMSRSNAEIPHYYVRQTIDMGPSLAWLAARNQELPVARRLLPAVLFLRATVLAAQAVPDLNGHWIGGALSRAGRVDLGVAVATRGGGLVTPAIPDAGSLPVDALMARLADLVGRARRGALKQAEMAGASITVSSLGEAGPDELYGVIFPPQVALVGVGGIVERPWAVDGMLTVRPIATVVLAADHRASDGRTASAFLATFRHALAHPEEL